MIIYMLESMLELERLSKRVDLLFEIIFRKFMTNSKMYQY